MRKKGYLLGPKLLDKLRKLWRLHGNRPGLDRPQRRAQPLIIGPCRFFLVKTDAAINKGATGTCSIYNLGHTAKGSETDTGDNLQVTARFGSVNANKWGVAISFNDDRGAEMLIAEC